VPASASIADVNLLLSNGGDSTFSFMPNGLQNIVSISLLALCAFLMHRFYSIFNDDTR
jgi:hypothetical protein